MSQIQSNQAIEEIMEGKRDQTLLEVWEEMILRREYKFCILLGGILPPETEIILMIILGKVKLGRLRFRGIILERRKEKDRNRNRLREKDREWILDRNREYHCPTCLLFLKTDLVKIFLIYLAIKSEKGTIFSLKNSMNKSAETWWEHLKKSIK